MHRFYAPNFSDAEEVELPDEEAQHLSRVLRLGSGDEIAVFDGSGREALARVQTVAPRRVTVRVVARRSAAPEPAVSLTLAQALLKSDKMDRVVRDAVMLGVAAIQPFTSRRTEVPRAVLKTGGRQERWERTVIASVKQCGRAVVPPVLPVQTFEEVLASTAGRTRLMFVEPGAGKGAVSELATLEGAHPVDAIVLIGPEGGWDTQEVVAAERAGVTLVTLGKLVLRADAAAAAALAILRYIWRQR